MKLLLSRLMVSDINRMLFGINTENGKSKSFDLNISNLRHITDCSAMVYSDNFLVLALNTIDETDQLLAINLFDNSYIHYVCKCSKNIKSMVSVFPGRIYASVAGTNSMNAITFKSNLMSFIDDTIHYQIPNNNVHGICCWNNRWYASVDGAIIELSNDRVVHSGLQHPTDLFFNYNQRLCFLEYDRSLFHCADDIWYLTHKPVSAIEDRIKGGYWILCDRQKYSQLIFIDYEGDILQRIDLAGKFSKIVEAQGVYSQLC
jgi:hypothetical protein